MTRPLRIAVADDEQFMLNYYRETLPELGHQVVAGAATGRELIDRCRETKPDLIIADIKMPDLDGIDAVTAIGPEVGCPVILVSAYHDDDTVGRADVDHVMAYLVKPIKKQDLPPAIAVALRRFEQFEAMRKESADLKQALADRKVIERAKGVLMKKAHLDEHEAFRRLQKLARDKNLKLVMAAQIILTADEALQPTASGKAGRSAQFLLRFPTSSPLRVAHGRGRPNVLLHATVLHAVHSDPGTGAGRRGVSSFEMRERSKSC